MIHDCGSFTIEYHHTLKPVMYLINGKEHTGMMNSHLQGAYALRRGGYSGYPALYWNYCFGRLWLSIGKRKAFFESYQYLRINNQQRKIWFNPFWGQDIMQNKTETNMKSVLLGFSGVKWASIGRFSSQGISFVLGLILARSSYRRITVC